MVAQTIQGITVENDITVEKGTTVESAPIAETTMTPGTVKILLHPLFPRAVIALTVLLCSPALLVGFYADDFLHQALLSGQTPIPTPKDQSIFGLFTFINGDSVRSETLHQLSLIPWWTYEGFQFAFWRPLSEVTHFLDHILFNDTAWLMHLHSILWYLLALTFALKLYRITNIGQLSVALALVAYAWDSTHGFSIAWLASRNTLVATTLAIACLYLHISAQRDDNSTKKLLAPFVLMLGLLAGEFAIATTAYLFAYAVCLDKRGPIKAALGLWPYALLTVLWWAIYKTNGFGAHGSDAYYIDLAENPLGFLQALAIRLPILLTSQWSIVPADLYGMGDHLKTFYIVFSLITLSIVGLILFPVIKRSATARFWLTGMIISGLPICAAMPQDRVLLMVGVGGSGLLGLLLAHYFENTDWFDGLWGIFKKPVIFLLVVVHLILSPILLPLMSYSPKLFGAAGIEAVKNLPIEESLEGTDLVLLKSPLDVTVFFYPIRQQHELSNPDHLWMLTTNGETKVTKVNDYTLLLEPKMGFITSTDVIFRDPSENPLRAGEEISVPGLTIKIEELTDNGHPAKATFTFDSPLTDPKKQYLTWELTEYKLVDIQGLANGESLLLN